MSDRIYWAILYAVFCLCMLISAFTTGQWTDSGFPHPMVIGALLSSITAIGLWLRKGWGRWGGILFSLAAIALVTNHLRLQGVTVTSVGTILFSCYSIWILWHLPITPHEVLLVACDTPEFHQEVERRMAIVEKQIAEGNDGIVILSLAPPVLLTLDTIAVAAERAFRKTFERRQESMDDPIDAGVMAVVEENPVVAGSGSVFICYDPPLLISIHLSFADASNPVCDGPAAGDSQQVETMTLALQPSSTEQEWPENPYSSTAILAAELVNDATATALLPNEDEQFDSATSDVAAKLRAFASSWSPENGQPDF